MKNIRNITTFVECLENTNTEILLREGGTDRVQDKVRIHYMTIFEIKKMITDGRLFYQSM